MKKAVVVGGSNGIGLAITNQLIKKGYFVNILDIKMPDENLIYDKALYEYHFIDLLHLADFRYHNPLRLKTQPLGHNQILPG